MSGNFYIASTGAITLPGAGAKKTVLQLLAPSNTKLKVVGWGVFFNGVSAADAPVLVELERNITSGTMDVISGSVEALGSYDETLQSTALYNATVEPVTGGVVDVLRVHPQQGADIKFPFGQEIYVSGGGRLAIACTSTPALNVVAKILFEE